MHFTFAHNFRNMRRLKYWISTFPGVHSTKEFNQPLQLFRYLIKQEEVHVIFVDYDAPELEGPELAALLRINFDQHCIVGFANTLTKTKRQAFEDADVFEVWSGSDIGDLNQLKKLHKRLINSNIK